MTYAPEVHLWANAAPTSTGEGQRYRVKGLSYFLLASHGVKSTGSSDLGRNFTDKSTQNLSLTQILTLTLSPTPTLTLGPTSILNFVHGGRKKTLGSDTSKIEGKGRRLNS